MTTSLKSTFARIGVLTKILLESPGLSPVAITQRLTELESAFIEELRKLGAWEEEASDLKVGQYMALANDAHTLTHRAKAARARKVIHAANGLCAVRKLRALANGNDDLLRIVAWAMMAEGAAAQAKFEPHIAAASGSRREQRPDEEEKHMLSYLLYLFAQEAFKCGDLKITGTGFATPYDMVAAEGRGEVYWPKSADGFRKQLSKWRKMDRVL